MKLGGTALVARTSGETPSLHDSVKAAPGASAYDVNPLASFKMSRMKLGSWLDDGFLGDWHSHLKRKVQKSKEQRVFDVSIYQSLLWHDST